MYNFEWENGFTTKLGSGLNEKYRKYCKLKEKTVMFVEYEIASYQLNCWFNVVGANSDDTIYDEEDNGFQYHTTTWLFDSTDKDKIEELVDCPPLDFLNYMESNIKEFQVSCEKSYVEYIESLQKFLSDLNV